MVRVILKFLVGLFILLMVVLALLPTIASSSWGQSQLVKIVNMVIPGEVSAKKISLSWFSKQKIESFTLRDLEGQPVVEIDTLSVDAPLWGLIFPTRHIGETRVEALYVNLVESEPGHTNVQQALFSSSPDGHGLFKSKDQKMELPFIGNITLVNGNIILRQPNAPVIELSNLQALVTIASTQGPITAKLTGTTTQGGQQGQFKVDFDTSTNDQMHLQMHVVNMPVDIIEQLVATRKPGLGTIVGELLGDNLSLSIDQTITDQNTQFQLKGHSSHLDIDLSGYLHDNHIILDRVGTMTFTLTPKLMDTVLHKEKRLLDYNFDKAIEATLKLDQLSIPLSHITENTYLNSTVKAQIELSPFALVAADRSHRFTFTGLKGLVESPEGLQELSFKASGALIENNQRAPISVSGKFDEVVGIDVLIEVGQLPLVLVDQMVRKSKGNIVEALGEHAHLSVHASTRDQGLLVAVQMKADRLMLPYTKFYLADSITLVEPTIISYRADPKLITQLIPQADKLGIIGAVPLKLSLQKFSMPWNKSEVNPEEIFIEADLIAQIVELKEVAGLGKVRFQDVQVRVDGTTLADAKCSLYASCDFTDKTTLGLLWGTHTEISGNGIAKINFSKKPEIQLNDFTILAESEYSKLAIQGNIEKDRLSITAPIEWQHTLLPETAAQLPFMQQHELVLLTPATLHTTIGTFAIDFDQINWAGLHVGGSTVLSNLVLQGKKYGLNTNVKRSAVNWEINGPANLLRIETVAQTAVSSNAIEGFIDTDILMGPWHEEGVINLTKATTNAKVNMTSFPVSVLSTVIGFSELEALIGNTVNAHLVSHTDRSQSSSSEVTLTLIGEQFQWSGIFTVAQDIVLQATEIPSIIRWTMTPERFSVLRRLEKKESQIALEPLTLADKSEIRLKITELKLPNWKYLHGSLAAEVSADRIHFLDGPQKRSVIYGPATMRLQTADLMKSLLLTLYLQEMNSSQAPVSLLEGTATIDNLLTANGKINQKMTIAGEAKGKNLPLLFLCNIACLSYETKEQIHALIGTRLDTEAKFRFQEKNGPFSIKIIGENGQITADAQLTNDVITLVKPLEAQLTVSPKLSQTVLEKIVPFLKSAISSDKPLKITVRPQGFAVPLNDLNMRTLQAPKVTIELGKITFGNKGQVADVIELLNRDKKTVSQQQTIWFTPLYIGTENGVVSIERLDMLFDDRFPIAMWGQVNFNKDKIDLKVGLTAETLRQSLAIGGLADDYMLVLPLKGTLSDAGIDKTKAAARISALIAQSQGGPVQIIGSVIDLLSGGLKDEHIPQPTTKPLPWSLSSK